jgi:hypothetical protein
MYNKKQLEDINLNLDKIVNESNRRYIKNFKVPNLNEYNNVRKDILDYIKENELVIYGGYAQNMLISKKNIQEQFYNDVSMADIEVYTCNPIQDSMKIADLLFKKNYKHVQVKEGMHNETYKVFSNFENYIDVSYIDENILNNMMIIEIDGFKFAHPHFMVVDAFRIYTDLLASGWRLEKTLTRFNVLMKHYSFISNNIKPLQIKKVPDDILSIIKKELIQNSDVVVFGQHAFNYYIKKVGDTKEQQKYIVNDGYFQVITNNLKDDSKKIIDILKKKFKKVRYNRYNKFYQFYGERIDVLINNQVVLKIYSGTKRCTVYKYSDKKFTKYGSFQLLILYLLVEYNQNYINKINTHNELSMISILYKLRDKFLDNTKSTIFDDTIFQEFTIDCIGAPFDQIRSSFEEGSNKIKKGQRPKFSYIPNGTARNAPDYIFQNHSGKLIE